MNRRAVGIAAAFFSVAALGAVADTNEMYVRSLTPVYSDGSGSASIGSLMPGTPVALKSAPKPGAAHVVVMIDGWSIQGADSVVYSAEGQRIILATLGASAIAQRKVLTHNRDAYGTVWNHVEFSAAIDPARLIPDVSSVWAAAHTIYTARCSACHALHAPTEFTANQWPGILTTMVRNAALDPNQAALVRQYLQTHARTH